MIRRLRAASVVAALTASALALVVGIANPAAAAGRTDNKHYVMIKATENYLVIDSDWNEKCVTATGRWEGTGLTVRNGSIVKVLRVSYCNDGGVFGEYHYRVPGRDGKDNFWIDP